MKLSFALFFSLFLLARASIGAGFLVTNTNDSGVGSLRQAVGDSNLVAGPDFVIFSLGAGTHTITLSSGGLHSMLEQFSESR